MFHYNEIPAGSTTLGTDAILEQGTQLLFAQNYLSSANIQQAPVAWQKLLLNLGEDKTKAWTPVSAAVLLDCSEVLLKSGENTIQ